MSHDSPLRAVTFDCWGTLIQERDSGQGEALRVEALLHAARAQGRQVATAEAARALQRARERHVRLWLDGVTSGAPEMACWALAELGVEEKPVQPEIVRAFAEASLSQEVMPLDGACATLDELATRGIRRALVCDTGFSPGSVVRQLLDRLGLLELLEVQVFSDEEGVPKPAPRVFRAALEPLGVAPGDAVHVGDLKRTDVAGGRGVGMRTVRIRSAHDDPSVLPDADRVADSHAHLREILRSLSR